MKRPRTSIPLCILAATVLRAQAPLDGEWKVRYNVFAKEGEQSCKFVQSGSGLKGTCGEDSDPAAGKVEGARVAWRVTTLFDGAPAVMDFSGTLGPGGRIAGVVTLVDAGVDGEFTAVKTK